MIVISDCSKDIVIPAGLGDNAGVIYDVAGVKSLNGETGDLKIKTVNGNDMLGEGNIEIKGGVETVNGETGDVKIKTVNGQSLMGEGDVPVDVGVETLNGQKGALTLKTVNGNELTGDGNIEIKAGVESVNGKTGAVVIPALQYFEVSQETKKEAYDEIANHWDDNSGYTGDRIFCYKKPNGGVYTFTEIGYLKDHSVYFSWLNNEGAYGIGDGKVKCFAIIIWYNAGDPSMDTYEQHCTIPTKVSELTNDSGFQTKAEVDTAIENAVSGGSTGSDDVIVLDNLTQEERKAVYDKLDRTKPIKQIFKYLGSTSFHYTIQGDWIKIYFLSCTVYNAGEIRGFVLTSDGSLDQFDTGMNYPNFLFFNVDSHTDEGADFECGYKGDYNEFMYRPYTEPNGYFLVLKKGIGDSTKKMVLPLTVLWDKEYDGSSNIPVRIQFTANGKLYTYLHGDADGKWLFESAEPITGGGATNALTYKQITNENRQEVYDDVKAHWSDVSGYTGNYVYFYQKDKDQIIFDEVKFEDNNAYFNSATVSFTSGQVHNPGVRLLCSIVPSEGNVQIKEKYTTISSIDGMQYRARGEVNGNAAIFFDTNSYGNGYGIYSTVDTGEENGLFGARFRNGIDGYKGNTPANIFTDDTDVFMAFDVVDFHYVYKVQTDGTWAFVSKTKIGGVQSSEVSNIKVLSQAEYDGLTAKDENVLYCIKG